MKRYIPKRNTSQFEPIEYFASRAPPVSRFGNRLSRRLSITRFAFAHRCFLPDSSSRTLASPRLMRIEPRTSLSTIASARAPPPKRPCHSAGVYCVQFNVDLPMHLRSISSNKERIATPSASSVSHPSIADKS